ncbi:MAG TPA: hypothetical protein DDW23_05275 [Planctomycetes bacterium]|nr:hypothetical protein [Planctomycetota bacterium]
MSNLFSRLFSDPGRKLVALGLAGLLWWQVQGAISGPKEHIFTVISAPVTTTPLDNTLQVVVPKGWVLVEPAPGSQKVITFFGPRATLDAFFANQCAATIKPLIEAAEDETTWTLDNIRAQDLDWIRSEDADSLLLNNQGFGRLRFERLSSFPIALEPQLVRISGAPAEGYKTDAAGLTFEPNQVSVQGPHGAMEALSQSLIAARAGGEPSIPLFEPLLVPSQSRDDLRGLTLSLSLESLSLGLQMNPKTIRASLPVTLQDLPRVEWVPDSEDLTITGTPEEGIWRLSAWTPTPWVAELRNPDLLPGGFDEAWVRNHVMLFLNLKGIPANAADGFLLPLSWAMTGIEDTEKVHQLLGSLTVGPRQNEDRLVPMDRVRPEDG